MDVRTSLSGRARRTRLIGSLALAALMAAPLAGQSVAVEEKVDLDAIFKIKEEGFQRSRAMETLSFLTDVHGPRLTNSPGMRAAAEYAKKYMTEIGLSNPHFEAWGPFGRGWANERTSVQVVSPQTWPAIAYPKAWTPGTRGPVTAEAVAITLEKDDDLAKYKGQLKGRFVLLQPLRDIKLLFEAPGKRYTDVELEEMSRQEVGPRPGFGPGRPGGPGGPNFGNIEFRRKRMAFLVAEGVAAIIDPSPGTRGDSGSVNVQGPGPGEGSRDAKDPPVVPQLVLAAEHYNRILRTLNNKVPVTLEVNVQNKFYDVDLNSFNIVGEIPGSDKADEIVMLGSHFDSWHGGSGATDNAVSCAVVMEAMRILKASGLKMRRTVRAALWTGEEQGLLGSRAYVKEHFADRETMQLKPEHEKLAAYFNQDNGGGAYRGVYLQGNEAVAPIFAAWMKPFHNLGMTTLTIRPTGGTDHLAFDGVGLPGFQFVQDPMEYGTRTHHTNLDLYDRVLPEDVMKNAVIMASFVYHAANRDQKLPRKPLPKPVRPAAPGATPTASR
jgi:carboxypeptidase Q